MDSQKELIRILQGISGCGDNEYSDDLFFDDLREHSHEDLQAKFLLDRNDTTVLHRNIQQLCTPFRDVYRLDAKDPVICKAFLENLQEDIHGNFYGDWSEYQRWVLRAWLCDLCEGTEHTLKDQGETRPYKNIIGDGRQE